MDRMVFFKAVSLTVPNHSVPKGGIADLGLMRIACQRKVHPTMFRNSNSPIYFGILLI